MKTTLSFIAFLFASFVTTLSVAAYQPSTQPQTLVVVPVQSSPETGASASH